MSKKFIISILIYSFSTFAMDPSQSSNVGQPFIRVIKEGDTTALRLASKTYSAPSKNLKVTLLSGMHWANESFFARHMELMNQAFCVLYEGKGLDKSGLEWESKPIQSKVRRSNTYSVMAKAYDLSLQLEKIDYRQDNFVPADYSFHEECPQPEAKLEEFTQYIAELDEKYQREAIDSGLENGYEYFISIQIERQKQRPLKDIVPLMFEALKNLEAVIKDAIGPSGYEKEFVVRNSILLNKFSEQLRCEPDSGVKHIVIYYGAGHMPYFEQELCKRYNLEFESEEWITAVLF